MSEKKLVARIVVALYNDGSLSVEGPVGDPVWCASALDNAADAMRSKAQRQAQMLVTPQVQVVPAYDVSLPVLPDTMQLKVE